MSRAGTRVTTEEVAAPRDASEEHILFEGLWIRFDARILRPRPWTALQSRWAADLLTSLPVGPVLELCAGAGHIGLASVAGSSRRLVCVDRDAVAVRYAADNAARAGLSDRVEIRQGDLEHALGDVERFALVTADPPWVPSGDIGRWPDDPIGAIDGGRDGLEVARACLTSASRHLLPGGAVLLQVGSEAQADALSTPAADVGLEPRELRAGERGVVVRYAHG